MMTTPALKCFSIRFPVKHPAGACRVCGLTPVDQPGWQSELPHIVCYLCCDRVRAIINPAKRDRDLVALALTSTHSPNLLTLALHNASGDWRRVMIHRRIRELRK